MKTQTRDITEAEREKMRLTPMGKRFGDQVKEMLKVNEHYVSKAVRTWKAWVRLEKSDPRHFFLQCKYHSLHGTEMPNGPHSEHKNEETFSTLDMSSFIKPYYRQKR